MPENSNMINSGADAAVGSADAAATAANISDSNVESIMKDAGNSSEVKPMKEEADIKLETPDKNKVIDTINESEDFITAVESVAAMYCVPSSHIVEDPVTDRLVVSKGHIVVPSNSTAKPSDNAKSIIQAVGAVLDYISQRADDKLDQFQADNIRNGIRKEKVKDMMDPSKGKVVATQFDANNDPVIVYDTGLADMENTKEAHAAYDEMENIPSVGADTPDYSYFTKEEDDITGGVDISNVSNSDIGNVGSGPETMIAANDSTTETDIAQSPGVSRPAIMLVPVEYKGTGREPAIRSRRT